MESWSWWTWFIGVVTGFGVGAWWSARSWRLFLIPMFERQHKATDDLTEAFDAMRASNKEGKEKLLANVDEIREIVERRTRIKASLQKDPQRPQGSA